VKPEVSDDVEQGQEKADRLQYAQRPDKEIEDMSVSSRPIWLLENRPSDLIKTEGHKDDRLQTPLAQPALNYSDSFTSISLVYQEADQELFLLTHAVYQKLCGTMGTLTTSTLICSSPTLSGHRKTGIEESSALSKPYTGWRKLIPDCTVQKWQDVASSRAPYSKCLSLSPHFYGDSFKVGQKVLCRRQVLDSRFQEYSLNGPGTLTQS
ncbi:hypothetical protein STEG23_007908, partial [Scotinomys teguina]